MSAAERAADATRRIGELGRETQACALMHALGALGYLLEHAGKIGKADVAVILERSATFGECMDRRSEVAA
jgi:hypothetical protein